MRILEEAGMSAVAVPEVIRTVQVVIGVDTHQDKHVAVPIDQQGVVWPSITRQRPVMAMGSWNGGPET